MRSLPALLAACILYCAVRLLVLDTRIDGVAMPVYELATVGNLAATVAPFARGEATAPFAHHFHQSGGNLVMGLATAAVFRGFGESYFALKLVPLVLGLVALVLAWRIAGRFFGALAASVTAFAFALPPPTLFKYSMIATGTHFESLPLQLGLVLLVLGLETSRRRNARLFAAAVVAGFAVFFQFTSLVAVAAVVVAHVVGAGPRRALRDVPLALIGFAIGLAPLLGIERATHGEAFAYFAARAAGFGSFDALGTRLSAFFGDVLPNAGAFEPFAGLPSAFAQRVYLVAFACALVIALFAVVRDARRGLMPFVLFPLLVVVAVGLNAFDFERFAPPVEVGRFRCLLPHFAFATVLFGASVAWAWQRRGAWRVAGVVLGGAVATTSLCTLGLFTGTPATPGVVDGYGGAWFHYYANVATEPAREAPPGEPTWDAANVPDQVAQLAPPQRRDVYEGLGHREAQVRFTAGEPEFDVAWCERLLARYDAEHSLDLARGVGMFLRRWDAGEAQRARLARALQALAASGANFAEPVVEGLCLDYGFPLASTTLADVNRSILLTDLVPPSLRGAWLRGRGLQLGRLLRRRIPSEVAVALERAEVVTPEERAPLWFGLGEGLADATVDARLPPDVFVWVSASDRPAFFTGYGAGVRRAWKSGADEQRAAVLFGLAQPYADFIERGLARPDDAPSDSR